MPPPILRHQPLGDDRSQGGRELDPDLLLAEGREHVDDSVDRLRGVVGVQGREDEVTGLGQGERELDGLEVAHLTDEEDVGVLAEGGAQCPLEGRAVEADLPLVDGGEVVLVHVLDGILDGEDVQRACLVDPSDDGGEGGRLSGAGRAGQQHEAAGESGQPFGDRRQSQLLEARDLRGDHPERQRQFAPLVEGAATQPGLVLPGEREVDVLVLLEDGLLVRTSACSWTSSAISAPGQHRRALERPQASVDPDPGLRTTDQQQVRTLLVPEHLEPRIDSFVVGRAHSATSVSFDVMPVRKPKRPAQRAGRFGSHLMLQLLRDALLQPVVVVERSAAVVPVPT